jgi:hypothetical protein
LNVILRVNEVAADAEPHPEVHLTQEFEEFMEDQALL